MSDQDTQSLLTRLKADLAEIKKANADLEANFGKYLKNDPQVSNASIQNPSVQKQEIEKSLDNDLNTLAVDFATKE
ncbi:MAG TPA: hypothetical protein VI981_01570 [Candidatus Paceibacterota bacterium]